MQNNSALEPQIRPPSIIDSQLRDEAQTQPFPNYQILTTAHISANITILHGRKQFARDAQGSDAFCGGPLIKYARGRLVFGVSVFRIALNSDPILE
jgi:hypothetical protein